MILHILLLATVSVVTHASSEFGLTNAEFEKEILNKCFENDLHGYPLVLGQERPLGQTLKNFIALAEKFEVANPTKGLREELFYFIRNFMYENFFFDTFGDVKKWSPGFSKKDEIDELWESEERRRLEPTAEDPFTDPEKCSLFFMLSHTILNTPKIKTERLYYAPFNLSVRASSPRFFLNDHYPMEHGVVAVGLPDSSGGVVSLGKVVMGLYQGLRDDSARTFDIGQRFKSIPNALFETQRTVDTLYTLTMAEVIALARWRDDPTKELFASDGTWISSTTTIDTSAICPMIYKLKPDVKAAYSYSSLRGALDGLILGRIVNSIVRSSNEHARLSHILRMYYSRTGVSGWDENKSPLVASFCHREANLALVEEDLSRQTYLYQLMAYKESYRFSGDNKEFTWKYFLEHRAEAFKVNEAMRSYCSFVPSLDSPEKLPIETPLDITAVMDTNVEREHFEKQQEILGYLADLVDLSASGSRMSILLDQKIASAAASANATVLLTPILLNSHSSTCVACNVTQIPYEKPQVETPEDDVIIGIDHHLEEKRRNETRLNGVNGKVVIYFNFEDDATASRYNERLDRNLRNLHKNHRDVTFIALGRSQQFAERFTNGDTVLALSAMDVTKKEIGNKIMEEILKKAPASLQYPDCETGNNERASVYEGFVTPNAIQHWSMPAKYFYKSFGFKIMFEAAGGPLRVCYSRSGPSSELRKRTCEDIPTRKTHSFPGKNECKGFNEYSCPPYFFSVLGINSTETIPCSDANECRARKTLDQVKFKVLHEGIRCSGSMGLVSTPLWLSGAILLLQILLSKKY